MNSDPPKFSNIERPLRTRNRAMQSPIYSALDSLSSPTIVRDGGAGGARAGSPTLGAESPLPALPLWQSGQDPFEALSAGQEGDSPRAPSPIPMRLNLADLTALERGQEEELEEPADEITLGALSDQINGVVELLELVREEVRLTKERQAQIQGRWICKGYLSLKLAQQYPDRFEKPASWDCDLENLTARSDPCCPGGAALHQPLPIWLPAAAARLSRPAELMRPRLIFCAPSHRLDLEQRTETQLRNVVKVEEDSIRAGILAVLQRSYKQQCCTLKNARETVESLRADCATVEAQKSSAVALAARRNACVATVNHVYQTMRTEERARDELARARQRLQPLPDAQAQQAHDNIMAKCTRNQFP